MLKTMFIGAIAIATAAVAIGAPGYCAVLYFGTETIKESSWNFGSTIAAQTFAIGLLFWTLVAVLFGLGHIVREVAADG